MKFSDVRFIPPWLIIAKRSGSGVSLSAISASRLREPKTQVKKKPFFPDSDCLNIIQGGYESFFVELIFL